MRTTGNKHVLDIGRRCADACFASLASAPAAEPISLVVSAAAGPVAGISSGAPQPELAAGPLVLAQRVGGRPRTPYVMAGGTRLGALQAKTLLALTARPASGRRSRGCRS